MEGLNEHLAQFALTVSGAAGSQAVIVEATLAFARATTEALTTTFLVGHAAGCTEGVRPDWMPPEHWRGRR